MAVHSLVIATRLDTELDEIRSWLGFIEPSHAFVVVESLSDPLVVGLVSAASCVYRPTFDDLTVCVDGYSVGVVTKGEI